MWCVEYLVSVSICDAFLCWKVMCVRVQNLVLCVSLLLCQYHIVVLYILLLLGGAAAS